LLFVVLSVIGVRQAVVRAIPNPLKFAVTAGIGMFLAFLGLRNAGAIVANPATFVTLGSLTAPPVLIALFGLLVTSALLVRRVKGAIVYGIIGSTVLGIVTRAPLYPGAHGALAPFAGFPDGVVALPVWPSGLVGALDIRGALALGAAAVVFTFFFVDFFDATGTLVALAQRSGALDAAGNMPRARRTFVCDGLAAMIGALHGLHRERERHRRRRPQRPHGLRGGRPVSPLDGAVAARRSDPGLCDGAGAHRRRRDDDVVAAAHRLGRLHDRCAGLPDHHRHAADVLDRERRQLRRDRVCRD
jgi:hypothetical protein